MTQEIQWGPAIAVDGKRPGWLGEDATYQWRNECDTTWCLGIAPSRYDRVGAWDHIADIRLPADHPHYRQTEPAERPIPDGMKAWLGGDKAPDDWDGGPVWWGNHEAQFYPELRTDPTMWHPADRRPHHMATIIAYMPKAAPIDWSGELEAVHEDGRVVAVTLAPNEHGYGGSVPRVTNECPAEDTNNNWYEDGTDYCRTGKWHIRNVPHPTPQADTKPYLTARAPCMTISEVREMVAKGEDAVIATMLERGYALPEPVDEDLIEARQIAAGKLKELGASAEQIAAGEIAAGERDDAIVVHVARAALARGRALALAGEKEA